MNAIQITETLRSNFIRYLLTTFNVERSDGILASVVRRNLESPGALFRGPFLELNPPYSTGRSLREMADEGVVNEDICRLQSHINPPHDRPLPPDRPLYLHQEKAIRRVLGERRNIVVASGTGSGKTECFLIPILQDLLTDPAPGVRALLIYPMNALVNDQLFRFRKLLAGTPITFGRYTSELEDRESQGKARNPEAPANEVISREKIRGNPDRGIPPGPPQILITNYAMLEYLLLRPEDSPIFDTSRLRFLCLDEAHTYTGAQGIEVSMLLRRLKQRLGKRRGEIQCIATSATLTENDRGAAARFASSLFGEAFLEEDVIFGTPLDLTATSDGADPAPSVAAWMQLSEGLRERLRAAFGAEQRRNPELIKEAAREFIECELAAADRIEAARSQAGNGDIGRFLWAIFQQNPQLAQLRAMMSEIPVELHQAGRELFGGDGAIDDAEGDSQRAEAVCRLVEIGAMARETSDSVPLLPARYHLFARAPQGAWLCLNPNCKNPEGDGWSCLYLEKREHCPDCNAAVYELTACRNCGQPYVRAFNRDGVFAAEGKFDRDTSGQRYFTWKPLTASDDDDEPADSSDACDTRPVEICLRCRRQSDDCKCVSGACSIILYQIRDTAGNL